jgi:anti-sigma factor RsiW
MSALFMDAIGCRTMPLEALVDGELSGAERLRVTRHLSICSSCAATVNDLEQLGGLLRGACVTDQPAELAGLASGVISRVRAERAQSWRAVFERAVDGWHWFLVGGGSLTAACLSILFLSAMLQLGPAPERSDSLASLLQNRDWRVLDAPGGQLYVWAVPIRDTQPAERAIIGELAGALSNAGKSINLSTMSPDERLYAESLVDQLKKLQNEPPKLGFRNVAYRLQLNTTINVPSKGI